MKCLVCSLVLTALASGPARADDTAVDKAKALAADATKLFNVQDYDKAADAYQQAYMLDPKPVYLYAIAQSQRLAGDCVKALRSYQAYLRTNPADPSLAQANIDRCEQYLKDHPPPDATAIAPVPLPPLPQTDSAAPKEPAMVSPPWSDDWIGHALVGVGVLAAGAGTYFYLHNKSIVDQANSSTSYQQFVTRHPEVDTAHTRMIEGGIVIGIGAAVIVGGVIHYYVHTRPVAETSVVAAPVPGGVAVAVSGSF